jgi:localization factor PodJL
MTSGFPGQTKELRRDVIDSAREAARRAGMSVEEWLDTTIVESARKAGIESAAPRHSDFIDRTAPGESADIQAWRRYEVEDQPRSTSRLADVSSRIDALSRQLDDLLHIGEARQSSRRPSAGVDDTPRLIADVIARLDRKIDRLIEDGRSTNSEIERRVSAIDRAVTQLDRSPAAGTGPASPVEQALAEIEARWRVLDAGATATSMELPRAPTQRLPELELQLRQINARLDTMRPYNIDGAIAALRDELAEIGTMIKQAMPREAVEALESEIHSLSARIDSERSAGSDNAAIAGVERGLAEVRDAVRSLNSPEGLAGLDQRVQSLSQKIDRLSGANQDPETLTQIEGAIAALRGAVSQVASNDALKQLFEEVRALSAKIDQTAAPDGFSSIGKQIAAIADALQQSRAPGAAPVDAAGLETVVKGIADKVDQLHATQSDQPALGGLEERIATLLERLDTSDERLNQLSTIERGLSDLQIQIEQQRQSAERDNAERTETDSLKRDFQRTQDTLERVQDTLGQVVERLATIEAGIRGGALSRSTDLAAVRQGAPQSPPIAPTWTAHHQPPTAEGASVARSNPYPAPPERRPIDPNLPPDHPLEPGANRGRGGNSPADRIAASEAALENVRPSLSADAGGKSNFIAAARRAAQAAMAEAPLKEQRTASSEASPSAEAGFGGRIRKLMLGASVVLLALAAAHFAASRFTTAPATDTSTQTSNDGAPSQVGPPTVAAPLTPDRHSSKSPSGFFVLPNDLGSGAPLTPPASPERESTGSIRQQATGTGAPPPSAPPTSNASIDRLPSGIGSNDLRIAAINGDAAAEFEVATRFADGRGVPQNLPEAAIWFERAAGRGLAPAQFRLGGLYEKGLGVQKNLDTARRLYLAAAEAGHAKAMHNLAVLYAEGIDGKPNYVTAARWFRKAADHGVTDSQYNLAILYARGIGVEANLAEAFKWFALASREGDRDAAKKRDEVAARLDKQSLAAAMAAAQAWQPQAQPESAILVRPLAGGSDTSPPPSIPKRNAGAKADAQSRRPTP